MTAQQTDNDRRMVEFMTALAHADGVYAANIRGDGRDVVVDLPDTGWSVFERADSVAEEFGFARTGAENHDARDKDRTAVAFEPEDN